MEFATKINGLYESITFNAAAIETNGNVTLQTKIGDDEFVKYLTIQGKKVTKLDLPTSVTMKLVSKNPFTYTIPGIEPHYYNKHKVEDYLYEITYGNIDYDYAYEHFDPTSFGGCSAIRNGELFGRNFDWLYNNEVQFIVHTPSSFTRYAVLGVSGIIPGIEQDNVDDEEIIIEGVDMFKLVPFYLLDGINEKGVFCTHNIVPLDNEETPTTLILALKEEKDKVSIPMLVRFVLDKFESASLAVNYLQNYTTLYFTEKMIDSGYQSHFMIGDKTHTYIIEFLNNSMIVTKAKYITNFTISDVEFDLYNLVQYPPTLFGINKYGLGLERWNLIANNYNTSNTISGMRNLLDLIKYSNCYNTTDFWYSEIVKMTDDSGNKITVDTGPSICTNAKLNVIYLYTTKDRDDPKIWITCHSCIYSIKEKAVYIKNLENETEYIFKLL